MVKKGSLASLRAGLRALLIALLVQLERLLPNKNSGEIDEAAKAETPQFCV